MPPVDSPPPGSRTRCPRPTAAATPCRTRSGSTPPTCPSAPGNSTPFLPTTPSRARTVRPLRVARRRQPTPGHAVVPMTRSRDVAADAVVVDNVKVTFATTHALDGVDLSVRAGTTLGVLGHNGAGKTTLIRVLTTLIRPDSGRVVVEGIDALAHPAEVRRRIGVTGQYAGLDEFLTTAENLELVGRQARRLTDGAFPGRAHHRTRPDRSAGAVGGRLRAHCRRNDGAAHHPVPGGSRPARRRGRGPRPRPHRWSRHPGR